MSIENKPLRLLPHQVVADQDGQLRIERAGRIVRLPNSLKPLFELAQQEASIARIADRLRHSQMNGRFALIARFVGFLYENDLIADRAIIRLAEALRTETRWLESIAFEPIAQWSLVKFRRGIRRAWKDAFALGLIMLMGIYGIWVAKAPVPTHFTEIGGGRGIGLTAFAAFVFAFFAGRCGIALGAWIVHSLAGGDDGEVLLSLDAVSIGPVYKSVGSSISTGWQLTAGLFVVSWGLLSAVLGAVLPTSPAFRYFLPVFAFLLVITELSPFVRSHGTEWLRELYNRLDQSKRFDPEELETRFEWLMTLSRILWLVIFAAFLVAMYLPAVRLLWGTIRLRILPDLIGASVLALTQIVIGLSIIDQLITSVTSPPVGSTRRFRRLFLRTRKTEPVEAAVQSNRLPSRQELESLPFLRQLDSDTRERLLSKSKVVEKAEGQAACRQGASDRTLYVVLSGRFAVAKVTRSASHRKVVAFLEPGAVFGEAAFFFGAARQADVVAMEPSRLLAIEHDVAMKTVDPSRSEEMQTRIWFLQSLVSGSFLRDLPSEALDALVIAGQKRLFKAGEKPISEGERADACYFIVQGLASVTQNTVMINRLKTGDAFGEIALLNPGTLRTATVIADSDLLTVFIDSERFWLLLETHLPLALKIEALAEARLKQMT